MNAPAPGSAEWLRYMTASKIAAVIGTSPYESRFSLWHRMHGDLGDVQVTPAMTVGNILEPALLAWFQQQHPDMPFRPGQWVTHPRIPWAAATPDGFAGGELVEAKTARDWWEWQDDRVPAGYQDQCQWQMWVTGATRTYVVALVNMELVERVVVRDLGRIEYLIDEAEAFMASLERGDAPPIDGSTATYQAVRDLHPDIDPESVEVPHALAVQWLDAREAMAQAADDERAAKAAIAAHVGNASRATWNGQTLFTRQARNGGTPYLVAARNLPQTGTAA